MALIGFTALGLYPHA